MYILLINFVYTLTYLCIYILLLMFYWSAWIWNRVVQCRCGRELNKREWRKCRNQAREMKTNGGDNLKRRSHVKNNGRRPNTLLYSHHHSLLPFLFIILPNSFFCLFFSSGEHVFFFFEKGHSGEHVNIKNIM